MNEDDELYFKIKEKYFDNNFSVKKKISKLNILDYFFKERKKIIIWNKKYNMLKFSLFQLKIKLKNDYKYKLDDLFIMNVLPLVKYLNRIILDGWQWGVLSIYEYNSIVYFSDFCIKMSKLEQKQNFINNEFHIVEEAFLKLTYNDNYPKIIKLALEKILIFYKKIDFKNTEEIKKQLKNLECFFLPNYFIPSFYDFILAYNICNTNRYLVWNDLYYQRKKDIINNSFYNCSREIFLDIVKLINSLKKEVDILKKEKEQIDWLKKLSKINNIDSPEEIVKFYESFGYTWNKDVDDFFLIFLLLTDGLLKKINEMIDTEFVLMTNKEKIIQIKILQDENIITTLKKLQNEFDLAKSKNTSMIPIKLLLKEFLRADYPDTLFKAPDQKYIYSKICNILSYYRELAIHFDNYIKANDEPDDSNNTNDSDDNYFRNMIVNPVQWRGKPVFSLFNSFISILLQICGYFKEKELISKLKKLNEIKTQLKSKEEKLESLRGKDKNIIEMIQNLEKN